MITLLCGPSSSGKSTLYTSGQINNFLGDATAQPILFAYQFDKPTEAPTDNAFIVHYNMMRPLHSIPGENLIPTSAMNLAWDYGLDPAWQRIIALPGPKQALVVVASKDALLRRVDLRRDTEPDLVAQDGGYNFAFWRAVYENANLQAIYTAFLSELRAHGVGVRFIASRGGRFEEISEPEVFGLLRRERAKPYSAEQIADLIKPSTFEYQRVPLPHGLATSGHDRKPTCDAIFPKTLHGCSVLDIGSALGAVCFEAEARGAATVVGLEPRASRFDASIILKEILGSKVELRRETLTQYLMQSPIDAPRLRRFDYVLLLNVIHHLDNPVTSLMQCASLTNRQLIIEFPTLDDPIFAGVPPEIAATINTLPLMGVSTRKADQTFLFTPMALERILLDHHKLFAKATFVPSPMGGGRVIGIFER